MNEVTYENVLWCMTVLNVVAGITATTLGVLAIQELRQTRRHRTAQAVDRIVRQSSSRPHKCLCDMCKPYQGNETPTQVSSSQLVRRSTLLSARERHDDLHHHLRPHQGLHRQ